MRRWNIIGTFAAASAIAAACTTTNVNTGNPGGAGAGTGSGGHPTGSTATSTATGSTSIAGSTGTAGSTSTGASTTTTGSSSTTSGSSSSSSGLGSCAVPDSIADCATCPDQASCSGSDMGIGCCENVTILGAQAWDTLFYGRCACADGATCYSVCSDPGDVCDTNKPSQDCLDCLDGVLNAQPEDPCYAAFQPECQGDADCNLFTQCLMSCPQQ